MPFFGGLKKLINMVEVYLWFVVKSYFKGSGFPYSYLWY